MSAFPQKNPSKVKFCEIQPANKIVVTKKAAFDHGQQSLKHTVI